MSNNLTGYEEMKCENCRSEICKEVFTSKIKGIKKCWSLTYSILYY